MNCHIITGATKTGKTTYVKKQLDQIPNKRSIIVYDVNNEYQDYYPYEFLHFEAFMNRIKDTQNSVMVFEEATIFFSNRSTEKILLDILTRKRHTNNYIFLCFHSLRAIPLYVYELANYITIFKTNDASNRVDQKFKDDRLNRVFLDVKNSNNPHYFRKVQIY